MFRFKRTPYVDPIGSALRAMINLEYRKRGLPEPADDELVFDIVKEMESWEKHG